jgi:conjugative transfer signal peptidase TraF
VEPVEETTLQEPFTTHSQHIIAWGASQRSRARVLAWALTGIVFGALSLAHMAPRLVWNFTPSAPPGLYRIETAPFAKGDLLAIAPAGFAAETLLRRSGLPEGRVLLKPLAAQTPDIVCRSGETVSINGRAVAVALAQTSAGLALPRWSGCLSLRPDQIFVLSSHPRSLDSRYFGPVPRRTVIGVARPVLTDPSRKQS